MTYLLFKKEILEKNLIFYLLRDQKRSLNIVYDWLDVFFSHMLIYYDLHFYRTNVSKYDSIRNLLSLNLWFTLLDNGFHGKMYETTFWSV